MIAINEAAHGLDIGDALLAAVGKHAVEELGVKKVLHAVLKDAYATLAEMVVAGWRLPPMRGREAQAEIARLPCRCIGGAFAEEFVQAVAEIAAGW